ncbi:MAG: hypothetical protein IIX02_03905 [Clostridia bacterium]|jgi:hypothetical protein|nr:hypothetical protein [Clostridia bacterium]
MKSFKEYAKQTANTGADTKNTVNMENTGNTEETQTQQNAQAAASAEDLAKRIARTYNGKSNASMLQNILAEAEKSKRAGTLSNAEIEAFYQSFAPMLDATQKRRLRAVVDRLKEI